MLAVVLLYLSYQISPLLQHEMTGILSRAGATDIRMSPPALRLYRAKIPNLSFRYKEIPFSIKELSAHWTSESLAQFTKAIQSGTPLFESQPVREIQIEELSLKERGLSLLASGSIAIDGTKLEYSGNLSLPSPLQSSIEVRGSYLMNYGTGTATFIGKEIPLSELQRLLLESGMIPETGIELHGGVVTPSGEISFGRGFTQKYWLTVQQGEGVTHGISFSGLFGTVVLDGKEDGFSLPPFEVLLQQASYGVDLTDIRTKISGQMMFDAGYLVKVGPTSFRALESLFRVGAISLRPKKSDYQFTFSSEQLSIEDLLKNYPDSPVKGTGAASLSLPIVITKEGVAIQSGKFVGLPPGGRIFYDNQGAAEQFKGTQYEIAMKALEDYRYSKLLADIDLAHGGKLTIKTSLSGTSPAVNKTRPVDVNVTIEENLFKLLESIQAVNRYSSSNLEDLRKKLK